MKSRILSLLFMLAADQKPIHVVHVIPTLNIGGAERFLVSLVCATGDSVRHTIVTLWDSAPLASELPSTVSYICVHINRISRIKRVQTLATLFAELGADVIHTHLFSADLWGRLAAQRAGIPVVTTEHNINTSESLLWRWIKRCMRRMSRVYTAPSRAIQIYLEQAYHVSSDRIVVIPHGIKLNSFLALPELSFVSPFRIGLIGRLVEQKGHRVLIDALTQLSDLSLQVMCVGSGELRDSLQSYAKEKGVSEIIQWREAVQDVSSVYAQCDIVVIPSLWEGFGLVALEAMASGRYAIASDVDGLSEIIQDGQMGALFPVGDSTALAQCIRAAVQDAAESRRRATGAREWVSAHGDVAVMGQKYAEVYTSLVLK